jgi:hypothetical protein
MDYKIKKSNQFAIAHTKLTVPYLRNFYLGIEAIAPSNLSLSD